jgi:hypothetical protein
MDTRTPKDSQSANTTSSQQPATVQTTAQIFQNLLNDDSFRALAQQHNIDPEVAAQIMAPLEAQRQLLNSLPDNVLHYLALPTTDVSTSAPTIAPTPASENAELRAQVEELKRMANDQSEGTHTRKF